MANPNIPVDRADIRYEHRGDCFVLVDPTLAEGRRDVATAWRDDGDRWRWRLNGIHQSGAPYPVSSGWDAALRDMLAAYARDDAVAVRLEAQRPRFSFGEPQIFRV